MARLAVAFVRDVGSIMPDPVALAGPMPKTLAEARTVIQNLRAKLGYQSDGRKGNKGPSCPVGLISSRPVPGKVDTQPVGGSQPVPPLPEDPYPVPNRTLPINPDHTILDLSSMAPRGFEDLLSRCTTKDVQVLLSRETAKGAKKQDASVVGRLYRELKKRGV